MKKNVKTIIISIVVVLLIFTTIIITNNIIRNRQRVPDNPPGTVGNSAGNLYNRGLFCESNGKVYFSNPYDGGCLYSMNPDQSEITKLASGDISHINAAGNYIYYYSNSSAGESGLGYIRNLRGVYRCKINGKDSKSIVEAISDGLLLMDNTLYFTNFISGEKDNDNAVVTVKTCTTNGEDEKELFREALRLGCGYNQQLYYAGVSKDHYLYAYDTLTGTSRLINDNTYIYMPIVSDGFIYYIDLLDNYHIKRCSLYDGAVEVIVTERVETYNLYGSILYYQTAEPDNYALKRIYTDGTGEEIIKTGVFSDINITGNYVYFHTFQSDMPLYMTPTGGGVNVTTFDATLSAAMGD